VTLEEGDIINIPTGIFRGFENIGTDYGMIMAVLGGDDAGGGVMSKTASCTTRSASRNCPKASHLCR